MPHPITISTTAWLVFGAVVLAGAFLASQHTPWLRIDDQASTWALRGPDEFVFAKLYTKGHVRADRWYKLWRTILYGSLEDEHPFQSVRRLHRSCTGASCGAG